MVYVHPLAFAAMEAAPPELRAAWLARLASVMQAKFQAEKAVAAYVKAYRK